MKTRFFVQFIPITIFISFFIGSTCCLAAAFVIPDTGVVTCYDTNGNQIVCPPAGEPLYGQDAHYGPGLMSLTNNGNGTVTDNNTGLSWEIKGAANGTPNPADPNDADNTYSWTAAQDAVLELNASLFAGHSDWRLPTPYELSTIIDLSAPEGSPMINRSVFPNCKAGKYWTSRAYTGDSSLAWVIDFSTASDDFLPKTNSFYVRAVRGGR